MSCERQSSSVEGASSVSSLAQVVGLRATETSTPKDPAASSAGPCYHVSANAEQKWCLKCPYAMLELCDCMGVIVAWICLKCGWHETEPALAWPDVSIIAVVGAQEEPG